MLTVGNTPKHRPRPQKVGAAGPQKTGRKPAKKMKKEVDKSINQLIGFLLFELSTFISIKNS